MTSTAHPLRNEEWLVAEHDWLDARLAAAFISAGAGDRDAAREELAIYQLECEDHLEAARRRLLSSLDHSDERTRAAERREWAVHARDIRIAVSALQQQLLSAPETTVLATFEVLRCAVRRHRADEARLLDAEAPVGLSDDVRVLSAAL